MNEATFRPVQEKEINHRLQFHCTLNETNAGPSSITDYQF
jgi:hypothetical protein